LDPGEKKKSVLLVCIQLKWGACGGGRQGRLEPRRIGVDMGGRRRKARKQKF